MCPRMGGYVPTDHKTRHQDGGRDEISIASLSGTPAALTTHEEDLDAHTRNLFEVMRTGEYYQSPCVLDRIASNTALDAADRLWAMPFLVVRDITVDRIAIHVTTQAGQKFRLGIYNNGTNLTPGTLLKDAGEVTLSGTGIQAITLSPSISLTKGLYWVAIVSNGTPTLYEFNSACYMMMGMRSTDFNSANISWYVAHSYAALPDPFGTPTADYRFWGIALRLESLD